MPPWNFVLQIQGPGFSTSPSQHCQRFVVPGLARPCRLLFYVQDDLAQNAAAAAHSIVESYLKSRAGVSSHQCGGPPFESCMTWGEKSCLQIIIPVIGRPVTTSTESDISEWQRRAGQLSVVIPALLPSITHANAFAGRSSVVSRLNTANWLGQARSLANIALQRAFQAQNPGLFISYRRSEAGAMVDQLHDELSHAGFRVFLDRFSGTPGRYFPHELAEEMSDKAVLLVIESPQALQSKWTLWEVAFAHRYRLGLIGLQYPGGPTLSRINTRLKVNPNSKKRLSAVDLKYTLDFIQREWAITSLRRRAFYEGIVAGSANASGGAVFDKGNGLLELKDSSGQTAASILPCGRPGQLNDVRTVASSSASGVARLLLGQHQHHTVQSQDDLTWLSNQVNVELLGRYSGYRRIASLC